VNGKKFYPHGLNKLIMPVMRMALHRQGGEFQFKINVITGNVFAIFGPSPGITAGPLQLKCPTCEVSDYHYIRPVDAVRPGGSTSSVLPREAGG
jgi:hypothetical protein